MDRKKIVSEGASETDRQFLDRTGVGTQIREVLTKIIENRPEDPVSFIADYFESQGSSTDRVAKAHQQLLTAHYTKSAFHSNLISAYDLLCYHKITDKTTKRKRDKGKALKGVTGQNYMELLNLLCFDFLTKVKDELFLKIRCRDHEVIPFDIFKSAVFTCLVLKDFLQQAKELYQALDTQKTNKVERVVCETLNVQLYRAVTKSEEDATSILEAGSLLTPDKIYSGLATAMFNTKSSKQTMTCDDFLIGAAESFLSKVKRLE